jgi:hypothetical protein
VGIRVEVSQEKQLSILKFKQTILTFNYTNQECSTNRALERNHDACKESCKVFANKGALTLKLTIYVGSGHKDCKKDAENPLSIL